MGAVLHQLLENTIGANGMIGISSQTAFALSLLWKQAVAKTGIAMTVMV